MRPWLGLSVLSLGCATTTVAPATVVPAAVVPAVSVVARPAPVDRDADGLPDGEDRCPDRYAMGLDGCDLPDRDGDFVIDRDDACLEVPEIRNGFEDEDGCPDELPKSLLRALRPIPRPLASTATQAAAKILSAAQKVALRRLGAELRAHPSVQIVIVGHQDYPGEIMYSRTPSGVAARAAKQFLVEEEGIEEDRILWDDAMNDEPIASNETAAGRAKNRRLTFIIILEDPARREVPWLWIRPQRARAR